MLTLKRCREVLGDEAPVADEDLERLRAGLYAVARVVVEALPRGRCGKGPRKVPDGRRRAFDGAARVEVLSKSPGCPDALAMLPEGERYAVEERAAIMEFDGGLDRDTAERAVFSEYWRSKHGGN